MKQLFNESGACVLGDQSAFSFLCSENVEELSGFFQDMSVKKGETLWAEGEPSDYTAFIISGRVEAKKKTDFEGKHVAVGIYHKGSVIGALGILDGRPRAVTAVALEDVSLKVITRENFEKLIAANPPLGIRLLKGLLLSVSIRLRKSFDRLAKIF